MDPPVVLEDSGIFVYQAFDNHDLPTSHRGFEIDGNNNLHSTDHDPVQSLKTKENEGVHNALVSTLFSPLESELDESLDIAMELDISLSESFDVNEVLDIAGKESNSFTRSLKLAGQGPDISTQSRQRREQIHLDGRPSYDKDQYFKQSFTLLPELKSDCKNKLTSKTTGVQSGRSSADLHDHSYSKTLKEVKFTVKTSKAANSLKTGSMAKAVTVSASLTKYTQTKRPQSKVL